MNNNNPSIDLDYIYKISPLLPKFKKSGKKFCFRCIVCGDSQKSKNKTRGNIYQHKGAYLCKCHNCGYVDSLSNFIKMIAPDVYRQYCFDSLSTSNKKYSSWLDESKDIPDKIPFKYDLSSIAQNILSLSLDHICRQYVSSRKLPITKLKNLWYIDNFSILTNWFKDIDKLPADKRLLIPFYDKQNKLVAIQGRSLEKNALLRYVTLKFTADAPLVYNFNNINLSSTIYCTEGPLDSLFLSNAIAIAGSDFTTVIKALPRDKLVIILDNESRNKEILQKYEKFAALGMKVFIWPDYIKDKDINDMIMNGFEKEMLQDLIDVNTFTGLKLQLNLSKWRKI
jgi:hypothetical protein